MSMQKCQLIREHQFEFANLEKKNAKNEGAEQATRRHSDIN